VVICSASERSHNSSAPSNLEPPSCSITPLYEIINTKLVPRNPVIQTVSLDEEVADFSFRATRLIDEFEWDVLGEFRDVVPDAPLLIATGFAETWYVNRLE
jgi:hypothetical protein